MIIFALCSLATVAALRLFHVVRPYAHIGHVMTAIDGVVARLERAIVVGIVLIALILPLSFGNIVQTATRLFQQPWTGSTQQVTTIVVSALLLVLVIPGCIVLYRLLSHRVYEFDGLDRFVVVLGASLCLLLAWTDKAVQSLPTLSSRLQLTGNILHLQAGALTLLLAIGLLGVALLSLFWLKRPFSAKDRNVLLLIFSAVVFCALLQSFLPVLLFLALLLLLLGVLVATQMERVS